MIKRYRLIGLLITMLVVVTSISVFADEPPYSHQLDLEIRGDGIIWWFSTDGKFSGIDVDTIEAKYWIGNDPHIIEPLRVVKTANMVMLIFRNADLPIVPTSASRITGSVNGETFKAAGPGFLRRKWT